MEIKGVQILSDFIMVVIGAGLIWWSFFWTPTRRGFYCDDESIRYPFNGETISGTLILLLAYLCGPILIISSEYILGRIGSCCRTYFAGFTVPEWLTLAYRLSVDYIIALQLLIISFSVIKTEVGSLRPFFIQQCRPNIDVSNCAEYSNSYITDYNCQTDDKIFTHESFPSGHSAMSAFITVFCVQYIQVKWVTSSNSPLRLWKHIFEAVVATAFFWITITRYTDNMHHPIDIIVGYAIGAVFALFTVIHVCSLTSHSVDPERRPLTSPRV